MEQIKKKSALRDFVESLLIAVAIALVLRAWIGAPFIVSGNSMSTTFSNRDYLIVDKLTYHFTDPKRGDVVVFKPPFTEKEYYIKRIIGLPGETISVTNNTVTIKNTLHPEGFLLTEPYTSSERGGHVETTLKSGEYFVMGDNRAVSSDSRVWGVLPEERLSGRVFIRLFPLPSIDLFPGAIDTKIYEESK